MFNFLHNWEPSPVLGSIAGIQIHWYGLMIALGIFSAYILLSHLLKYYKLNINLDLLLIYLFIGGVIGGRLYYVFYAWPFYQNNLLDIFKVWQGGMALHGDIIGALLALLIYSKKYKISFRKLLTILTPAIPLMQSIGRWGNYFNQELFGTPSNLPWSIPIKESLRPEKFKNFQFFHPTFLYESILDFILFIFLYVVFRYNLKYKKLDEGIIFIIYLFFYSMIRLGMELLRQDYSPYIFGLRWFQFMSIILISVSFLLLIFYYIYKNKNASKN